jgi:adenine-specific DNA-methyltransferase
LDLSAPCFTSGLITYLGNKRRLLPFLNEAFSLVRAECGGGKLTTLDPFCGSGAPARLLKAHSRDLWVADAEAYCATVARAGLANASEVDGDAVRHWIGWLNEHRLPPEGQTPGFIEAHYAPRDDEDIQPGERAFYTHENARAIDHIRHLIATEVPPGCRDACLSALLVEASVHANTSGVFKGFHKKGGVGHFGGRGETALARICAPIHLEAPVLTPFECPVHVLSRDANDLARDPALPDLDLAYLDPPYNQHPYGSNYFMLGLIDSGQPAPVPEGVSGITRDWRRSRYNSRREAAAALEDLVSHLRASFVVISYNAEGLIAQDEMARMLSRHGEWDLLEQDYSTYRGSRNLHGRSLRVKELLWVLRKG